jgi:putative ABC transport system substrate-binding protein
MQRREFIALFASAATSWPLAAHAQQPGRMWRIGLITHWPDKKGADWLRERFRELGYVEGQNIIVEPRYAEGKAERFQEFAEEMVRLKVDIIMVFTTPAALAAKNATTTHLADVGELEVGHRRHDTSPPHLWRRDRPRL